MKTYRHGDIDFIPTTADIKGLKQIGSKQFTVAEGESTGHHHVIKVKDRTSSVEVFEGKNGEMIISVNGKAVLTHPEHKTLEFPTGTWEVRREQEYDWFSLETRRVID